MSVPKTLLIDTEGGATTVNHLIEAGHVIREEAESLDAVEKVLWKAHRREYGDDLGCIVLDTLTALMTTNRHLYVRKESGVASSVQEGAIGRIWDKQLDSRRMYQRSSDPMIMMCRQFRSLASHLGVLTIITAHEGKREDEQDKSMKGGPAVNPMLLADVMPFSDDVFRVQALVRPRAVGGKTYPKGTRLLYMAENEDMMTKIRIGRHLTAPEYMEDPDLYKLQGIMQEFFPRRLTLFGPWGAGKTALSTSLSDPTIAALYEPK
jgi:hypothetical protein